MARKIGVLETRLRALVADHVAGGDHGVMTRFGNRIGRTSSWVGQYLRAERHASLDDSVAMLRALGIQLAKFVEEKPEGETPRPSAAERKAEAKVLRVYRRIRPASRTLAFELLETLARRSRTEKTE